jgi:hypothetical protein
MQLTLVQDRSKGFFSTGTQKKFLSFWGLFAECELLLEPKKSQMANCLMIKWLIG